MTYRRLIGAVFVMAACAFSLAACSEISLQEYAELVEGARACSEGDTCVLAGSGQCICPAPVNATQWESIEEAAADVDCNGAQVECPSHDNVRCEAGRCVSDTM